MPSAGSSSAEHKSAGGPAPNLQRQVDPIKIPLFKSTPTKSSFGDFRKTSTPSPSTTSSEQGSERNRLLMLLKLKNAKSSTPGANNGGIEYKKISEEQRRQATSIPKNSINNSASESDTSFHNEVSRLLKESVPVEHVASEQSSPTPRSTPENHTSNIISAMNELHTAIKEISRNVKLKNDLAPDNHSGYGNTSREISIVNTESANQGQNTRFNSLNTSHGNREFAITSNGINTNPVHDTSFQVKPITTTPQCESSSAGRLEKVTRSNGSGEATKFMIKNGVINHLPLLSAPSQRSEVLTPSSTTRISKPTNVTFKQVHLVNVNGKDELKTVREGQGEVAEIYRPPKLIEYPPNRRNNTVSESQTVPYQAKGLNSDSNGIFSKINSKDERLPNRRELVLIHSVFNSQGLHKRNGMIQGGEKTCDNDSKRSQKQIERNTSNNPPKDLGSQKQIGRNISNNPSKDLGSQPKGFLNEVSPSQSNDESRAKGDGYFQANKVNEIRQDSFSQVAVDSVSSTENAIGRYEDKQNGEESAKSSNLPEESPSVIAQSQANISGRSKIENGDTKTRSELSQEPSNQSNKPTDSSKIIAQSNDKSDFQKGQDNPREPEQKKNGSQEGRKRSLSTYSSSSKKPRVDMSPKRENPVVGKISEEKNSVSLVSRKVVPKSFKESIVVESSSSELKSLPVGKFPSSINQSQKQIKPNQVSYLTGFETRLLDQKSSVRSKPNVLRGNARTSSWKSRRSNTEPTISRRLKERVVNIQVLNKIKTTQRPSVQPETHSSKLEFVGLLESDADNETDGLSSAVSDCSSDAFDVEQELSSIRKMHLTQESSSIRNDGVWKKNNTDGLLVRSKPKNFDPEAERRRLERIVGRQLTERFAALRKLNKKNLISLVETGIAKHTPFEAGIQVTGSNDICNINNYEITPVLYLQYLSKGGRLSFTKFDSRASSENVDYSIIGNFLKNGVKIGGDNLTVFFDKNQDLTYPSSSLVAKRYELLKAAFTSVNIMVSPVFSSDVDIVILLSGPANHTGSCGKMPQERTTFLGRRVWNYQDAEDFLRYIKADVPHLSEDTRGFEDVSKKSSPVLKDTEQPKDNQSSSKNSTPPVDDESSDNLEHLSETIVTDISNDIERNDISKEELKAHVLSLINLAKANAQRTKDEEFYWFNELKTRERLLSNVSDEVMKDQMKLASLNGQMAVKNSEIKKFQEIIASKEAELEEFRRKFQLVTEKTDSFQAYLEISKKKEPENADNSNPEVNQIDSDVEGEADIAESGIEENLNTEIIPGPNQILEDQLISLKKAFAKKSEEARTWRQSYRQIIEKGTEKLKSKGEVIRHLQKLVTDLTEQINVLGNEVATRSITVVDTAAQNQIEKLRLDLEIAKGRQAVLEEQVRQKKITLDRLHKIHESRIKQLELKLQEAQKEIVGGNRKR